MLRPAPTRLEVVVSGAARPMTSQLETASAAANREKRRQALQLDVVIWNAASADQKRPFELRVGVEGGFAKKRDAQRAFRTTMSTPSVRVRLYALPVSGWRGTMRSCYNASHGLRLASTPSPPPLAELPPAL